MQPSDIVAILTGITSIAVKVVGLPDQIRENHRRKSTAGVSVAYFALAFISYCSWIVEGFFQHDKVVIIAQGLGIFTTGAILWQIFTYRKPRETAHPPKLSQVLRGLDGGRQDGSVNDA